MSRLHSGSRLFRFVRLSVVVRRLHVVDGMDFRSDLSDTLGGDRRRRDQARRLVMCHTCGRTEAVAAADLPGYMESGWPRCCGEVMTYYLEADWSGE